MAESPGPAEKTTPYQLPVEGPTTLAPPLVCRGEKSWGTETNLLRQSRLRAAALFLTATAAVLVVWSLLTGNDLWPLHALVGICLVIACVMMSRREPVAPFPLKLL